MSKKLIAVVAAAALAITGLVAAPANATSISSVTIQHSGSDGGAQIASHTNADDALTAKTWTSARNVVFGVGASFTATRTAIRFDVLTTGATPVTVTSTAGVKIATAVSVAGVALKVDAGSTTLTGATTAGSAATLTYVFYAWSTSTTAGTVVIETTGSKSTYYVKGTLGPAYNIASATFPTSLFEGQTTGKITYTLSDAYGNLIADGTKITPTGFGVGAFNAATYSTTTKLYTSALGTVDEDNVALQLNLPAFDLVDYKDNGFAAPVRSFFKLISAGNLSDQNTALTTQVTALTAQVAALSAQLANSRSVENSVTKKKYNSLARKWNASNPSARVALKK